MSRDQLNKRTLFKNARRPPTIEIASSITSGSTGLSLAICRICRVAWMESRRLRSVTDTTYKISMTTKAWRNSSSTYVHATCVLSYRNIELHYIK